MESASKAPRRALRVPTVRDVSLHLGPLALLWMFLSHVLYTVSVAGENRLLFAVVLKAVFPFFLRMVSFLGTYGHYIGLVWLIWSYFSSRTNKLLSAILDEVEERALRAARNGHPMSDACLKRRLRKCHRQHTTGDGVLRYETQVPKRVRSFLGELINISWIPPDICNAPEVFTHMTLHPIDRLARYVLRKYLTADQMLRVLQWRRVNPTLNLRAKHLSKYNKVLSPVKDEGMQLFNKRLNMLVSEAGLNSDAFLDALADSLADMSDYSEIVVKGSSAAGWPYPPGTSKSDVRKDAEEYASREYMEDLPHLSEHLWYTGGRGKLVFEDEPDSSRMVSYAGFPYLLILSKYSQVFNAQFNATRDLHNSSIGMSWFHGGAYRFKQWFVNRLLGAPAHYASLDVSGWDASIQSPLLEATRDFHIRIILSAGGRRDFSTAAAVKYANAFKMMYNDMIKAKLVLPQKLVFQCTRGMKSGFALTATDNTIIHTCVFYAVLNTVNPTHASSVVYKVYGDDNFFAVPNEYLLFFNIESIKIAYTDLFGFVVRPGPTSGAYFSNFGGPDFLSKHVRTTENGVVYAWRSADETYRRLIHPDCFTVPPGKEATLCRLVGHYIDNFSNVDVRVSLKPCIDMLASDLSIIDLDISKTDLDKLCWTLSQAQHYLKGKVHLPDLDAICLELYGDVVTHSRFDYDALNHLVMRNDEFDPSVEADDAFLGDAVATVAKTTNDALTCVHSYRARSAAWRKLRIYRSLSPYEGIGGWRVAEALKRLSARTHLSTVTRILDIGAHPGASTCALIKHYPEASIRVVSKIPLADESGMFCPKLPTEVGIKGLEPVAWDDGRALALSENPDLVNIDILSVDEVNSDASHNSTALDIADDVINAAKPAKIVLIRLKSLDDVTCSRLHAYYMRATTFVAFRCRYDKPFGRNIVIAMHMPPGGSGPSVPLRKARFIRCFNALRNALAEVTLKSIDVYKAAIENRTSVQPNPAQGDEDVQSRLRRIGG